MIMSLSILLILLATKIWIEQRQLEMKTQSHGLSDEGRKDEVKVAQIRVIVISVVTILAISGCKL